MTRRADTHEMPLFVSRETAARRCEVSVPTFDMWVREGFLPPPAIKRGQITRWHWPTIEARLAADSGPEQHQDPYVARVLNAKGTHRAPS